MSEATAQSIFERLAPGSPLRLAMERVVQQRDGAIVVVGYGRDVEAVCSGGFDLDGSAFTVARLAELAKMDGAIILDEKAKWILKANVHLLPDARIPTKETGSRHRTAERVAVQTGRPVITVSQRRGTVSVFHNDELRELERPSALVDRVNTYLHTLERFRRRLDDAVAHLDRMEVAGLGTTRQVLAVVQRAELVSRIAAQVEADAVGLGGSAELIDLQIADLSTGAAVVSRLVVRDYLPVNEEEDVEAAILAVHDLAAAELADPFALASALGFDHPDAEVEPRGIRLLNGVPRLPSQLQHAMLEHFVSLDRLIGASVLELEQVEGIGQTRAIRIRRYFDRWVEAAGWVSED